MSEKLKEQFDQKVDTGELQSIAHERSAEVEKQLEKQAEKAPKQDAEKLAEKAEKLAEAKEKKTPETSPAEKRKDAALPNTKAGRKAAFNSIMSDTRTHMAAPSRAFSKFIHNPVVEKTSEFVGATVARPNALLAGSATAFLLTLVVYMVAKHYGYPLTGTESIAAFVLGWILGIMFDYLRVMITGKRIR